MPVGIFDSGLGGLTVHQPRDGVRRTKAFYLGDNRNTYGMGIPRRFSDRRHAGAV